ncbi:MAG: hypothetical protein HYU86_07940 [Chloroflexi bacterium]|nr:hypothetical protein [Chloroflexota bacterium]
MPNRAEMKGLAQEIIRSYDDRMADLAHIQGTVEAGREATQRDLKEIHASRTATGQQLRNNLARGAAELRDGSRADLNRLGSARSSMGKKLQADLAKGAADLRRDTTATITGFHQARAAMGRELAKHLAQVVADIAREVAAHRRQTGAWLRDTHRVRAASGKEMKAQLAGDAAQRRSNVEATLKSLDQAHNDMAREMRDHLAKNVAHRKDEVSTMLGGFQAELHEVRAALDGGLDEWLKMAATLAAKRGAPVVEKAPTAAPSPVAVRPVPSEAVAEEEAVSRAEVAEVTPELAALRERVFEYLANNPDGARLVELEQEFTMARIQMARVIRTLMDENRVQKRGLLYFAT